MEYKCIQLATQLRRNFTKEIDLCEFELFPAANHCWH